MMRKRIMASCLALVMVLGMSLNSFAALRNTTNTTTIISGGVASTVGTGSGQAVYTLADGTVIHERSTRRVSIADFNRLRDVCNEKYSPSLVKREKNAKGGLEGTAEPVGSDVTDPENYDNYGNALPKKFEERKWTGRTVDQKTCIYGGISSVTGKPIVEKIETAQLKLQSMHDYVSQGQKIRFVNGLRLSDTEFVIRVDCDIQEKDPKAPQSFRGDYYVSVLPYKERVTGSHYETDEKGNTKLVEDTEAVEVPDEFGDKYNNKMFGPAWFFCMLFDETQAVGKQEIIGYLVARRITRWPDWNDNRFYYGEVPLKKNGVDVPNPTQIARESATVYKVYHKDGSKWFDKGTEMKTTGKEVNFKADVPAEKREETGEKVIVNGRKVVDHSTFFDVTSKYPQATTYPTASIVDKEAGTDWLDYILSKNRNF